MEYLEPFAFFKVTQGLVLHFKKPEYDWFKSRGMIKCAPKTFDARKDARMYAVAASKIKAKEIVQFYLANILEGNNNCVYNFNDIGKQNYQQYVKKIGSLTNVFSNDLNYIGDELEKKKKCVDGLFESEYNTHPMILKMIIGNKLNLETVILIDKFCRPFVEEFDEKFKDDAIWNKISGRIKKYSPFVDGKDWLVFDQSKVKITWFDFVQDSELNKLL